jgi:hypothetical protein
MKSALILMSSLLISTPCFAGQTATCNPDGSIASIGDGSDYANADFIYSSPCPPAGANPDAVCLTEAEFTEAKSIPTQYLKCRNTDGDPAWEALEEATQAEKDAIDAPELAAEMERQAYATEIGNNSICDATLQQIGDVIDARRADFQTQIDTAKANLQTSINASTNIATARTAMTAMNNTYATGYGLLADDLVAVTKQIGRCLKARSALGSGL